LISYWVPYVVRHEVDVAFEPDLVHHLFNDLELVPLGTTVSSRKEKIRLSGCYGKSL
jgi:hypothetical protein